ncbi:GH-E family nuclease [Azovibrio restrictus]|uniref:GH-E family nuclease n=1 Tax=Azovibrio restrictus TaxID=146938 RepID=UPI003CCC21CE
MATCYASHTKFRAGSTQAEFNEHMNNPDFYQIEAPKTNCLTNLKITPLLFRENRLWITN